MKNSKKTEYDLQAEKFLELTQTEFNAVFVGHGIYFDGDTQSRDIYSINLMRNGKSPFIFKFGQSIANSGTLNDAFNSNRKSPSTYDVLACLTKYNVGTFEDFCNEFGYSTDSKRAEKVYFAVQEEWENVSRLWNANELELLRDIQ